MRRYEKRLIERALRDAGGVITHAARLLGYSHNALIKKLNQRYPELLSQRTPAKPRKHSLMFIRNDGKGVQPLSLLHVEDDETVADVVKDTLEAEGWTVEILRDGATALQLLQGETHYDLLIFDNELPDTSGVELVRRVRRLPHRWQTPIIMLSASDVRLEARRAGANVFLEKPNDLPKVAETVARLLARKHKAAT